VKATGSNPVESIDFRALLNNIPNICFDIADLRRGSKGRSPSVCKVGTGSNPVESIDFRALLNNIPNICFDIADLRRGSKGRSPSVCKVATGSNPVESIDFFKFSSPGSRYYPGIPRGNLSGSRGRAPGWEKGFEGAEPIGRNYGLSPK
jgi:hypothetical protein